MEQPNPGQTVRQLVLHRLHDQAAKHGLSFFMTQHFLERVNARCHDEEATFSGLAAAVNFVLGRLADLADQRIGIKIDGHFYFLKASIAEKRFICLTYYYNTARVTFTEGADRRFILTRKNYDTAKI